MPLAPNEQTPTVYVVDDDDEFRASLVMLLEVLQYKTIHFGSTSDFLAYYRPEYAGCLILDVRMPRQSGLQLYEQMVREGKRLPVIFMTAHADIPTAVAAMKTGAIEFLEKPFDRHVMVDRINSALKLDAQWRSRKEQFSIMQDRIDRLNDRDRETLTLILAGETNKAMAEKLFISERAVEMRRSNIMKKLDVATLAELLDLTISHRIYLELGGFPEPK
jgi:FixJ family two-component response regulator